MKVFLSYASEERPLAERICRLLESEGHDVFFDRDDLAAGDAYGVRIRNAIEACHAFVFLVSPTSVRPGYALAELALVEARPRNQRPTIVPVLAAQTNLDELPPLLQPLTVLEARGDLPAEVAACVAAAQMVFEKDRVRLLGMPGNDGWMIYIDIADKNITEIFYKFSNAPDFARTGFGYARHPQTGRPLPNTNILLPGPLGKHHDVVVKYTDEHGRERGPYVTHFDPEAEYVRFTKQVLSTTTWLAAREYPERHLLVYFSHLISYKNAFKEIRYSVDDESLSRQLQFAVDWSRRGPPPYNPDRDETFIEIPYASTFVAVKLLFIDGTESNVQRFAIAEMDVDRG